jgi:REP element-mobilizing transposase RayT
MIYESMAEVYPRYNFKINGFVIMPNHLHIILVTQNNNLSEIIHDIKGNVATKMFKKGLYQSGGPIWQRSFYDHVIRNEKDLIEKLNYIHSNPLRAGLVEEIAEYKHSSFKYYYDEKPEFPVWFQKIGVI